MEYDHTQKGHFYLIMWVVASFCFVNGWVFRNESIAMYTCWGVALIMVLVGASFKTLTVCDMRDELDVRFGPIPLFGTRIRYEDIQSVAVDHTKWLDGWGIHWVPGRGMTYNIWGFDCVRVQVGSKTIRVGTDDPQNLCEFLQQRLPK
jgi:hypothetical protein